MSRALVVALCLWMATAAWLLTRPAASLETTSGLYAPEQSGGLVYRWSGDRVVIPITRHSGPTAVRLRLAATRWEGRSTPYLSLHDDRGVLTRFAAPEGPRNYYLRLPPGVASLTITSTVDRPPARDPRWVGFTLFSLSVRPGGWPVDALARSLALLPVYLAVAAAFAWSVRRGLAAPLALFGLALGLRVFQLQSTPPGWRVDEVISLVDAWHLSRTGRDHLGHLLPLGAFEALGDWISPLLTYLELPFVALFGPERMVGRMVTAVAGALAAPLGYALARALGLGPLGAFATGLMMALSPWQVFISRVAMPPSLVPTVWTLCLLAGVRFIERGDRRAALGLALAAGVALYAYPTLKLAVPLLTALAVALALLKGRLEAAGSHAPAQTFPEGKAWPGAVVHHPLVLAGLLLALLWAPFVYVTLFVPASSTRLNQAALRADSWEAWFRAWWAGYAVYFQPDFYYRRGDGSSTSSLPGFGVEFWASLPLLLLGLAGAISSLVRPRWKYALTGRFRALFILGAVLIAALPASLTTPSPHAFRAAPLAPLYALLVGWGAALLLPRGRPRPGAAGWWWARWLSALALAMALLWQGAGWWRFYTQTYPPLQAGLNHDGLAEAVRRTVELAPGYAEVWVSADSIAEPYVYILAARPFPPDEARRLLVVKRQPGRFNHVISLGPYRFVETNHLPAILPTLAAVPGAAGGKGYVVQEWNDGTRRVLVLRQM
ncbi:MAG: glycosyltransferase family 39 protein [Oscillochloridaceae bacterium]|nr:glycosyltransferase family 39 protein [Chloroflexaceae bacterium]MDW8390757.1 glycosyltransferase family 39 protein [Oscillochloridaceae bacterium]